MFDFYISPDTGDLVFEDGDFRMTQTKGESLRQRIYITLNCWRGDWFWDTTFGVPYRESILGKPRTKDEVDAIFLSQITQYADEYESLDEFTTTYDRRQRTFDVIFRITVGDGEEATNITLLPADEELYPNPPDNPLEPICPMPINYILSCGNWLAAAGHVWGDNNATEMGNYFYDEDHPDGRPIEPYYYCNESGTPNAEAGNSVEAGEPCGIPLPLTATSDTLVTSYAGSGVIQIVQSDTYPEP